MIYRIADPQLKGRDYKSRLAVIKLLQEAFPAIKQDASGAASAFGYRIDREAEEATSGAVKQGHTGTHINYYDKKTKVRGSITIEPTKTGS